ncbi:hypothetical protein AGMMS49992_23990 [Clostridia bacterium]|nr:hypothetical protein AGMMS49992_23990 [Clostridia bacterium]
MESRLRTSRLHIGGMTCVSCQNKISRKLRNTAGIQYAEVSYSAGTAAITYDTDIITMREIEAVIDKLDYRVLSDNRRQESDIIRVAGTLVIVVSLYVLLQQFGILNLLVPSQLADAKMRLPHRMCKPPITEPN